MLKQCMEGTGSYYYMCVPCLHPCEIMTLNISFHVSAGIINRKKPPGASKGVGINRAQVTDILTEPSCASMSFTACAGSREGDWLLTTPSLLDAGIEA